MERKAKQKIMHELQEIFAQAELVVLVRQSGLSVAEAGALRAKGRNVDVRYKVTKNSLARIALQGSDYEHLQPLFSGPTAIVYGQDAVAAAKLMVDYSKEVDKFEIVGGAHKTQALDVASVRQLAKLPSLDGLRGRLIGILQAPAGKLACVVQAPSNTLARVIGAYGASA